MAMGTHNALLGLGPRFYLEVIAVDPDGATPSRPRWFDLDEPRMKAALAEGPHLATGSRARDDIDAAVARLSGPRHDHVDGARRLQLADHDPR